MLVELRFCSNRVVAFQYRPVADLSLWDREHAGGADHVPCVHACCQQIEINCVQAGMVLAHLVGRPTCLRRGPLGLAPCGGPFGSRQALP